MFVAKLIEVLDNFFNDAWYSQLNDVLLVLSNILSIIETVNVKYI